MSNLRTECPKCGYKYVVPLDRELVRTLPQNKLYWGVYLKIIAEHIGELCLEDLHEELKLKFNPKDSRLTPGNRFGGTTTKMTRKEFTQYLEKIRIWAFQFHGIVLPEGDEQCSQTNV